MLLPDQGVTYLVPWHPWQQLQHCMGQDVRPASYFSSNNVSPESSGYQLLILLVLFLEELEEEVTTGRHWCPSKRIC